MVSHPSEPWGLRKHLITDTVCSEGEERRGDAGPRAVAPHRVVLGDLDQKHDAPRVRGSGRG